MTIFALSRWHWSGVSGSNRCRPDPSETFSKLLELAAVKQDSCFLCSYSQIWCLSMTQIILLQAFQAGKNGKTLEKSVQPPFPPFYNVLQFLSFICSLPPPPPNQNCSGWFRGGGGEHMPNPKVGANWLAQPGEILFSQVRPLP